MEPTRSRWADTFPTAQWTQTGPLDDSQARLTWVDSGAVITDAHDPAYIGAPTHTNNTGELTAMYRALERALGRPQRPHVIHSGSLYTIHMTTGRWMTRWKGARNRDLINATRVLYRRLQRERRGWHTCIPTARTLTCTRARERVGRQTSGGGREPRAVHSVAASVDSATARAWLAAYLGDRAGVSRVRAVRRDRRACTPVI